MNISEMRKKGMYDYVANHYWEMSKEELKDCVLELTYAADEDEAIDSLEEMYEGDE